MTAHEVAEKLPSIAVLRMRCKSLALLDAIVGGEYYTYDRAGGFGEIAAMNDGGGDEYSVIFGANGVLIWGIYHESAIFEHVDGPLWPTLIEGLPGEFNAQSAELAFGRGGGLDATFIIWRRAVDSRWLACGGIDFSPAEDVEVNPDGSWLLNILIDNTVSRYVELADEVYEIQAEASAVEKIVAFTPLAGEIILQLNPAADVANIRGIAEAMGYPLEF